MAKAKLRNENTGAEIEVEVPLIGLSPEYARSGWVEVTDSPSPTDGEEVAPEPAEPVAPQTADEPTDENKE